jgi:hypothetical protein
MKVLGESEPALKRSVMLMVYVTVLFCVTPPNGRYIVHLLQQSRCCSES